MTRSKDKIVLHYDKDGVPYLSNAQIEELADEFLRHFCPQCLASPMKTPLTEIALRLAEKKLMQFDLQASLGEIDGKALLGQCDFHNRWIKVDGRLPEGGSLFNFTLAHELAHFALHRKAPYIVGSSNGDVHEDDRSTIMALSRDPTVPRGRVEHQANRFAAALLMPARTVPLLLRQVQGELRWPDSLQGWIYLDHQPDNRRCFFAIVNRMKRVFCTSFTAAKIRLDEMNLLREEPAKTARSGLLQILGIDYSPAGGQGSTFDEDDNNP